jgi:hypothetical protein
MTHHASRTPLPIETALRRVSLPPATQSAEVRLNEWILQSPATRTVYTINKTGGYWVIGLAVNDTTPGGCERLTPGRATEYHDAVASALEIARLAGYP